MHYWKKQHDKAVLRDRFIPIVKPSNKPEYRPTARTKLVVDAERNNSQIFLVTKETPAGDDGTPARIDEYVPATVSDISKGAKVICIVETSGLWFGANQFGMSLVITHILVWPTSQKRGIEAFSLPGGMPKCVPSAPPSSRGAPIVDKGYAVTGSFFDPLATEDAAMIE